MKQFDFFESISGEGYPCYIDIEREEAWVSGPIPMPNIDKGVAFSTNVGSSASEVARVDAKSEDEAREKLREKLPDGAFSSCK